LAAVLLLAFAPRSAVQAKGVSADGAADPDGSNNRSGAVAAAIHATSAFSEPYIRLEKNDDYYDAAGVVVTEVTSLFIDADEAWARYQSGELDDIVPPLSSLDEITAGSVYSPHLHVYPSGYTHYYGFSNDVPPFDDPLVRGAFASAIDRGRLISDTLNGDELPALTFVAPGSFGHVDGYAAGIGRPYSPTLAVQLLTNSGYTGTPTITLMYSTDRYPQGVAELARQMWIETLGVTVTLKDMEWGSYLDLLNNGSADERPGIFRLGWGADYPDANNWLNEVFHSSGYNWARYNNPAYDALVEAAASETVSTTRLSLYEQAETYLVMTDTAIAPLYYFVNRSLTRPDLARTYRHFGGQHLDEWDFTGTPRPLEIVWKAPSTLDPALAFDRTSFNYVEQLFLGLTDFDKAGNAVPELATSWDASPDLTVYTFTMRSDVTWTNGISAVTAYDVEYGVLRSLDPATGSGYAYILYIIENAQAYNEGSITDPDLVGVEALDDTHIRFTLTGPAAYFPVIAGLPPARPQPQWAIDAHGDSWTNPGNIVTNGPYKLAAWQQAEVDRVELWLNPSGDSNMWGDAQPGTNVTVTTPYTRVTTWADPGCDGCWNMDNVGPINPGDTITVEAGSGLLPVVIDVPNPFTAEADSDADTVFGQIGGWTNETVEVHGGFGYQEAQTDASGYYTATYDDVPRGGSGYVRYVTEADYAEVIFHRPFQALDLVMTVDYEHDWVNGNYEAGHTVWITLTESDGSTVKAAAELTTGPVPDWGGQSGFNTEGEDWSPSYPNIEPGDWVYGLVNSVYYTTTVHDATDTVWGYGPPHSGSGNNMNVGINDDWQPTSTDETGYYEVQYDRDITPDDNLEVEYSYPEGHQTRYGFGPSDVGVSKRTPIWNVVPGDEYSYFIDYSNNASGRATDVVITDTLPFSVTYLWDTSGFTPAFDPINNTLVWHLGALASHRSETFELRVELDAVAPQDTQLRNYVEISDPDDRDPGNNRGETDVQPSDPWADTWVNKSLEASRPVAGEVITYQLYYGNNGNQTANSVVLTDTLPAGTTFVTSTFEVGVDGLAEYVDAGVVVWDIGMLEPGESHQFEMAVQIGGGTAPGTLLTDEIVISSDQEGGDNRDNKFRLTTVVEEALADLWVDKNVEGDLSSIENEIVYRITWRNDGTLAAQDVVLTDTLPVSMTHLWHSAGSAATLANGTIVWQLGTVPPGGGGQLLVGARASGEVPAGTVFTNTVEASTSTPELDYDNNLAMVPLGPPRVICVPWAGPHPHRVWSGLHTTLKGTAKGYGLTTFEWDPGDGSPVIAGTVSDPYVIEASHLYYAPVGTVYIATLTVWGAFGWSDTDTYTVQVFTPTHGVEVDVAVDEGLWYIHKEAQRYRSGGLPFAEWHTGGNGVAETASAIQAFQVQGHRPGGDPWEDPYVEDVQSGWNALFTYSKLDATTVQPAGDPDSDGDGAGIGMYDYYGSAIYESGLAMMALATTGTPGRVARTGPPIYVRGQTYYTITQNMADWFAWGQNDDWSGWARGGWRYQPNSGDSDNSNTQFPVLGLAAAVDNWGIIVPTWVKDELRDYWLADTQNPTNGGFGYADAWGWVNVGKTGAGIMNLAWTGVPVTDTRVISASQFIETNWYDAPDGNWNGNVGEFYAMYAVKKGSKLARIHSYGPPATPHLWNYEYSAYLVGVQNPDGSFDDAGNFGAWQPMATSWAVMILSPGLYQPLPVPIISPTVLYGGIGPAWGDGKVRFDASLSYHTDPEREIVLYEWNFGDGSAVVSTTSRIASHTYGARGVYLARLTVWDDADNSTTEAAQVYVTAPDTQPVADPGGPYAGHPGQEIVLDGSGSYDSDAWLGDAVTLYAWDIAGGSLYTTTEATLTHTWAITGIYPITLSVQDRGRDYGLDSPRWSEPATTMAIIDPATDVSLAKTDDPDPVTAGSNLTYTLTVVNNGPLEATGIVLTDRLPPNVTFVSASAGCVHAGGTVTVTCDLGNLAPTAATTVTIVAMPNVAGTIVNFAVVAAHQLDHDPTNDAASEDTTVTAAPILGPRVTSITPNSGFRDVDTAVTIEGSNFQPNASASLDGNPLQSVSFINPGELEATVPAGLGPGTYDLTVVNPDSHSGVLLDAFTVLEPERPPSILEVVPVQGPNDLPVTVDIYGLDFAPGLTATLSLDSTPVMLEDLLFIDSTHLRAIVPINITPGFYTLTVTNPDGLSGALLNAYEAIEATVYDDLYANDTDLWLDPPSVRQGDDDPTLGLNLRRQGGQTTLTNVEVDFYQGDPFAGGTLIARSIVPSLAPDGIISTTVTWNLPGAGTYDLYAVIDPDNNVLENNEGNNVISHTVTVHLPLPDITPPVVDTFTINDGAANTEYRQVRLSATAHDNPGGSGVASLLYIEYEFIQSIGDWVPVASSGWLPYTDYPWLLQPTAGVRYLQVWAADRAGNTSPTPLAQPINYLPPVAHVAQSQVHIYRLNLTTGQSLRVRLTSLSGDADLYVWGPDNSLVRWGWTANVVEEVEFTAEMDGVYQIEVEGWTSADYRLEIIPLSVAQAQVQETGTVRPLRGRADPFVAPLDTPTDDVGLPSAPVSEYYIYMPIIMRQK